MKAGKALEQLVAAIQEYLGDNPDTHIERNAKLTDNAGLQREIDVFVQTKVQGGKIGIAFLLCRIFQFQNAGSRPSACPNLREYNHKSYS